MSQAALDLQFTGTIHDGDNRFRQLRARVTRRHLGFSGCIHVQCGRDNAGDQQAQEQDQPGGRAQQADSNDGPDSHDGGDNGGEQ